MPSKEFRQATVLTAKIGRLLDLPEPPAERIKKLTLKLKKKTRTAVGLYLSAFLTAQQHKTLLACLKG